MKNIKLCLLWLFCMGVCSVVFAQKKKVQFNFAGTWHGQLSTTENGKPLKPTYVKLKISKTDTAGIYNWDIQYTQEEKDIRHYRLIATDTTGLQYKLDEGNGIVLSMTKTGNTLSSTYKAGKILLTVLYRVVNGKYIEMEVFSYDIKDKKFTEDKDENSVTSYVLKMYQRAMLQSTK